MKENQTNITEALPLFENTKVAFSDKSDDELKRAYRLFKSFNSPVRLKLGKFLTEMAFALNLPVAGLIKRSIFKQFCGGETLEECEKSISELAQSRIKTILEYSVEAKSNEVDYDSGMKEIIKALDYAAANPHVKGASCKISGLGRLELFEKVHRGATLREKEKQEYDRVKTRMEKICQKAMETTVGIYFDAEESWIQNALDVLINEMMQKYNQEHAIVFNTFQLYRLDRLNYLKTSFQTAKEQGYFLGAKLVRGAYMEKERERAEDKNYPSPIHPNKKAVDINYNAALDFCVDNGIALCAATHNEESCLHLAKLIQEKEIEASAPVFFSQLYGMGENLTYNLAEQGLEATKLIPYGPVKEVIPYLMRRAKENSSVAGQVGREFTLLEKEMKRRKLV